MDLFDVASREFEHFAEQPESITAQGMQLSGVDARRFTNWRWQMKHQIIDKESALRYLPLVSEEREGFASLDGLFKAGITPYYLTLAALQEGDCSVRLQALPRQEEAFDPLGMKDPLEEKSHSPVKEVVHVYPDRVAFCVAMLCPVYCRYCYRKRRDDEEGLHYNRKIVEDGLAYIASTPAIKDVLITGGDPFIASDATIAHLLTRLRAIPHVEIIRFGTRTPVTLPYRVTKELAAILAAHHPVWVNTHFNSADEITPEASQAINNLLSHGIPVGNQAVLLKGVNDSPEKMMALCRKLIVNRVRPYYVFHPHLVAGTAHLRTSIEQGRRIMKSLQGNISGFGIPRYIVDTPSGKVPIDYNYVLGSDNNDLILEDIRGEIWRERG
jgi:lysine 2,3-aminomutase